MMATLAVSEQEIDDLRLKAQLASAKKYNDEEFMNVVSTKEPKTYGTGSRVDCSSRHGCKKCNIAKCA